MESTVFDNCSAPMWLNSHMPSDDLELNPCRHGELNPAFCSICKDEGPRERVIVYFTSGGMHFHSVASCTALAEGQKIIADRGGTPSHIESGFLDNLKFERKPCKTCTR
jgi:hypothetical protein